MQERKVIDISSDEENNHQGRNAQRIRVFLGIKQEVLANELGISQPQVSEIERQEIIDEALLSRIANVLGVSSDLIKKFDVERAIYNINNYKDTTINANFKDTTIKDGGIGHQEINPIEKVIELYERLLQSERDKLELFISHNSGK